MAKRLLLQPAKTQLKSTPWRVNLPATITRSGKRERHFFRTRQDAETFCRQQRTRLENFGRNSTCLSPSQLEDAAKAFDMLAPAGCSLNEAVAFFLRQREASTRSVTFTEMFERFIATKANRSAAYLHGLRYTLPRFAGLHERLVSSITPADIEAEMQGCRA